MKVTTSIVCMFVLTLCLTGCGDDNPVTPDPPPVINSCAINGGAAFTLLRTVSVAIDASDNNGIDELEMRVSLSSDFSGASWSTYQSNSQFEIPAGDGVKTIYAQVKDASGNLSKAASDDITVAETSTVLYFDPTPLELASGETGTLDLEIVNAQAMVSGRFELSFDPSLIEITDLVVDMGEMHLLRLTGASLIVSDDDIDNADGTLVIGALGLKDGFEGVTGDGPFAKVTVRAKAALTSPTAIAFDQYEVYNYVIGNPPELATNVFTFDGEIE